MDMKTKLVKCRVTASCWFNLMGRSFIKNKNTTVEVEV